MHIELKTKKIKVVAQARFEFGTDGSAQKSTLGYRAVKQLPSGWVKTVSWLNQGKIHVVAHDPLFERAEKLAFSIEAHREGADWNGTASVEDRQTVLILLNRLATHSLDAFPQNPFSNLMSPMDCSFNLIVWTH